MIDENVRSFRLAGDFFVTAKEFVSDSEFILQFTNFRKEAEVAIDIPVSFKKCVSNQFREIDDTLCQQLDCDLTELLTEEYWKSELWLYLESRSRMHLVKSK